MEGEFRPDADVLSYYTAGMEKTRLSDGEGQLEFERTKELLLRHLPSEGAVLDVGGGVGTYAEWLVGLGYSVHLVEPVPFHVEEAERLVGSHERFTAEVGDARALRVPNDVYDAVLLLGPLYHLSLRDDRSLALREAMRVCRPGGVVVAAAICRYAPLLDALRRGTIADDQSFANVQEETRTGKRVEEARRTSAFPDAYFHLPRDLKAEFEKAGLTSVALYGVEGPGWLLSDFAQKWNDPVMRERVLAAARIAESDRNLCATSGHLLAVGHKTAPLV